MCWDEFLRTGLKWFMLSSFFPRDALIVSFTNSFTSILAGFVIFSAIGYMAHIHNLPVDNIATDGKHQAWKDHWENASLFLGSWEHFFFFLTWRKGFQHVHVSIDEMCRSLKDKTLEMYSFLKQHSTILYKFSREEYY